MVRQLYSLALYLLLPAVVLRLSWRGLQARGYWQGWGQRFGLGEPLDCTPVWVHAVSVGEAEAAATLVRAIKARHEGLPVLVTTTTPTGLARVRGTLGDTVLHRYLPYDLPDAVGRFLSRVRPRLGIILETEVWPNLVESCARHQIPLILANARLSERSARGYRRVHRLIGPTLRQFTTIATQTEADRERFLTLGARAEQTLTCGSVKFDARIPASAREEGEALRSHWGTDRPVWIAASTHEGEEEVVLDAHEQIRIHCPRALLILVPRHPERFARTIAMCRRRGWRVVTRSSRQRCAPDTDVFVGDTMGELPVFYGASDIAFVGGSLVPTGGHNMLEAAAMGLPVIFGPHVFNFAEIARRLQEIGAAQTIENGAGLVESLLALMADASRRHDRGQAGKRFVEANRGALTCLLTVVEGVLAGASPADAS